MTVENVLERTVVRAAAPGGGAEAAGVETGSLLVALDGQSTKVRTHGRYDMVWYYGMVWYGVIL